MSVCVARGAMEREMDRHLRVVKFCPKWRTEARQLGRRNEEGEEAKMMERQTSGRREGEFSDGLAS